MRKITFLILLAILGLNVNAQFANYGLLGSVGFDGPEGNGLQIKSGINPEFGFIIKYHLTKKFSIRTFITFDYHHFTLINGSEVNTDAYPTTLTVQNASNYSFGNSGVTQHLDLTYNIVENKLDVSGGVFWSVRFTAPINDDSSRIFYGASANEILTQPNQLAVYNTGNDNPTNLYANDQIQQSMMGITGGLYLAASGGTKVLRLMLRYDWGLKNYYSAFSSTNKIHEGYARLGVIYYFSN